MQLVIPTFSAMCIGAASFDVPSLDMLCNLAWLRNVSTMDFCVVEPTFSHERWIFLKS